MASSDLPAEICRGSNEDLDDFIETLEEVESWLWRVFPVRPLEKRLPPVPPAT